MLNIKQIKEGIKKEKEKGFGSHYSAANIIGGLNCNKNQIADEKENKVAKPFT